MKKTAIILMIITIISKFFGLARDLTLSYFYGASNVSDAYLISITIPMVIFSFIGKGISTGYIPLFSKITEKHGDNEGNRYTNNLINVLLIVCSILIVFGNIFAEHLVKIFASGFEGETLTLAILFTRITLVGIYFIATVYIFSDYLRLKGNYLIPALVGFPMNFIIMIAIYLSTSLDVYVLVVGNVIATITQLILLIPFCYSKGYKYKPILNIKDEHITTMAYLAGPVILGIAVNEINVLIDRTLASRIAVGGISSLNYANKLNGFVQGIFVLSIATVLYPMISKMSAENNIKGLKKAVTESIGAINLLVLPATVGAMVFANPIVHLIFGRGAFDLNAVTMTSYALFFYSIGMIGVGLRQVLSRVFYSMQDTKTPMINASIGVVLNIILNIILSRYLGIGGLALATSIAALFTTILMFISLRKKIGPFGMKQMSISFLKILFASLVMGLIAKLSFNYLTANIFSQNLSLMIAIGIGALTYFAIIYFMKIDDVDVIVNAVKKKLKRSKASA